MEYSVKLVNVLSLSVHLLSNTRQLSSSMDGFLIGSVSYTIKRDKSECLK